MRYINNIYAPSLAIFIVLICVISIVSTKSCQKWTASLFRGDFTGMKVQGLVGNGSFAIKRGNFERGIGFLNKAVELDPNCAEAYSWRCIARAWTGDTKGAIVDGDKAIQLDPESFENWARRAVALYANGDFHDSGEDWQKVLKRVSDHDINFDIAPKQGMAFATANALAGWGATRLAQGENGDAARAIAKAIKIFPEYDYSVWGKLRPDQKDKYEMLFREIKSAAK